MRTLLLVSGAVGAGLAWHQINRVRVKNGVVLRGLRRDVMQPAIVAANLAAQQLGLRGATITSGLDGVHMRASKHDSGEAIDVRRVDWPSFTAQRRAEQQRDMISAGLGPNYDVVLERDHVHIEYDPKTVTA